MTARRLLLDAGNTRLKWAVVEGGRWVEQGSVSYSELFELSRVLTAGMHCFIASVARAEHDNRVNALLESYSINPTWLKADAECMGVRNHYENPQQLGVDRWMGLIAARRRNLHAAVLVVSAGTAVTVDALSADGVFLGGLIVPGITMMQQALQQGTARVSQDMQGRWQAFPRTTADAVQSGILAAVCGAIERQYAQLAESARSAPHCLLTGGDASRLLPHLKMSVEQIPGLVLEGLDLVSVEDESV